MPPVNDGIIQAHPDALRPESLQEFPYQIPPAGRIGRFKIRQLGVKQAVSVMMLGGEHSILHSRFFRQSRPLPGIIILSGKLILQRLIGFLCQLLHAAQPLSPSRDGIQPPMDEHAEPCLLVPLGPLCSLFHDFIHYILLFIYGISFSRIFLSLNLQFLYSFPCRFPHYIR